MDVLTVFAHHSHNSFCHAVLERFDAGLRDAGHTNEVVRQVEHVYFYAVHGASDETRRQYLERAYGLGRDF